MVRATRPLPELLPEVCKGCGRCIEVCARGCIAAGTAIDPRSGHTPIQLDLTECNGCALCVSACPEPFGLRIPGLGDDVDATTSGGTDSVPCPEPVPDRLVPLPPTEPVIMKGNHAAAVGALLAGCRTVYGYPITPSTEGAELMAKLLPELDGVFVQAVSEVATINHLYGAGGAGERAMTFTSSPGFSLMLEGISYLIGAQVPAVIVNVMRGGPGLGNIGPTQSDVALMCRAPGHGDTHAVVLAPSTPQEMLDLTMDAFRIAFEYRNPVIVAPDGYLGQMTGRVRLPDHLIQPGLPAWAVTGDREHRRNLICSIALSERELEDHNLVLQKKYERIVASEARAELTHTEDASILLVAATTVARMARGAVRTLRQNGVAAGLLRPITLWPFPTHDLAESLRSADRILVVEASAGQLRNEVQLALAELGATDVPVDSLWHTGGILPSTEEIVGRVMDRKEVWT